jgi:hypothetical protein
VTTESVATTAAAEPCPFTSKCMNSEGVCATCDKSPWYESDHKCTCGPAASDWMTEEQCTKCSTEAVATTAAVEPCPFTSKCMNSEGVCATCNKSPWYDSDHKCTCGPAASDWMTEEQCTKCSTESVATTAAAEPCPFTSKCMNSEGVCATCDKSPWYNSDHKCACGPAASDWMTEEQCTKCSTESVATTAAAEPCPFTSKCMNSESVCATCDKSPWYDSDHKCTCGPAASDWMTEDQCTKCSTESVATTAAAEPCPFTPKCMNSQGVCATCDKSPWYDTDHKCTCGPAASDWMTEDQCTKCSTDAVVV